MTDSTKHADEIAYATRLVTRSNRRKAPHLVWRGWHFYEDRERVGLDPRVPLTTRRTSANYATLIVGYRKRNSRFNLPHWVTDCVYELLHAPMVSAQSYDGVPWEIHRVYPLDAYLAALAAYQAESEIP